MDLGLTGKVALVTGGSDGIGKATAMRLAQEGAKVVICARQPDVLEAAAEDIRTTTGGDAMAVPADVSKPDDLASLFDKIIAAHGRIDILVNNAGIASAHYFEDATDEIWAVDLELKLFGVIRCCRLAIPYMKAQGGGRIINVTWIGGKAPVAGSTPTSVSRAAGIALTKVLSKDYAADNILVNTVCIGQAKSGQWKRAWERSKAGNPSQWERSKVGNPSQTLEQSYEEMGKNIPLGRVGEAEEVGDVIAFLASERASYVSGTSVHVDGGAAATV